MHDNEIRRPAFDLGDFRYAVARYIRLLIAAHMKQAPDFLSRHDLERWELPHPRYEDYSEWSLLEKAAEALGRLNTEYIARCGSGGVTPNDDSTPVGRLISAVAFFVPPLGGGPNHNGWLIDAANHLDNGEQVKWSADVQWDLLQDIRNDLDRLPRPSRPGPWSSPRSPQEWRQVYSMGWDTLKKLFDDQSIRNDRITMKLYKVHTEDLPPGYDDASSGVQRDLQH